MKKLLGLSTFLALTINVVAYGFVEFELTDAIATRGIMRLSVTNIGNDIVDYPTLFLSTGLNNYHYVLTSFVPTNAESYTLGMTAAPFDPVMILYSGTFNPNSPGPNALVGNDDTRKVFHQAIVGSDKAMNCANRDDYCPQITYNLAANQPYTLLVTTYSPNTTFNLPIKYYSSGIGTFSPGEPTPTTTIQANLQPSALAIQNFIILQDLNLLNNIKQEITGSQGWSFSTGGTYESVASFASQNTINLRANYLGDNYSFSSFLNKNIDYNASTLPIKTVKNVNFGGFITVNPTGIEKGWEVKLGLAGGSGDLKRSREAIDGITEPGSGINPYKSLTGLISGKYKSNYQEKFSVEPYLGLSFNHNNLSSYQEIANPLVSYPLTFEEINSENTILFSGVKTSHQVEDRLKLIYNLEVNYDINPKITPLIATGLAGLSPVNFKPSKMIRYLVGFKGLFDLNNSSSLIFDCTLQTTPFEKKDHILIELGYKIHL